jgi:hypothetical protein
VADQGGQHRPPERPRRGPSVGRLGGRFPLSGQAWHADEARKPVA